MSRASPTLFSVVHLKPCDQESVLLWPDVEVSAGFNALPGMTFETYAYHLDCKQLWCGEARAQEPHNPAVQYWKSLFEVLAHL